MIFSLGVNLWFLLRQPETLPPAQRRPLSLRLLGQATVEIFRHRITLLSILCQGLSSACLIATLSSQQGIFEQHFDRAVSFPSWFAAIAVCSIAGSVTNARLVNRVGMARMVTVTYAGMAVLTGLIVALLVTGLMPAMLEFPAHLLWSIGIFAMMGLTLGNLSAMAMEESGPYRGLRRLDHHRAQHGAVGGAGHSGRAGVQRHPDPADGGGSGLYRACPWPDPPRPPPSAQS